MELKGQDKDLGIQNSFYYNQARAQPQSNQESPISKLSSTSVISNIAERRRRSQAGQANTTILNQTTLDHQSHLLHHHQLNPHQLQTQTPELDPNPNPDPDPSLVAPEAIASPSNPNPPPQTAQPPPIRFRECLKNHAAAMGGHAVDGCGEFMPGGEEGTAGALKCAACDCHRNFHRKEVEGESQSQTGPNSHYRYNFTNTNIDPKTTTHQTQFPIPQRHQINHSPHGHRRVMLGFGGSGPADSSSEDLNNLYQSNSGAQAMAAAAASKKRFRTKFSQEQRDGMQEFAERLGWKIQKQDEEQVLKFCDEMGVKRRVFKVWMHNNKQAMKKKNL